MVINVNRNYYNYTGCFSVGLWPPVVANLFNLHNCLYRRGGVDFVEIRPISII